MSEDKKIKVNEKKISDDKELDLEELNDVSGGALRNVSFTKTRDISRDTKDKI